MSKDIIYREDAIKAINLKARIPHDVASAMYASMAINAIYSVQSADRPQGYYIKGENGEWYCSNCKRIDDKYSVARFCWYCGARMRGADDE